MTPRLTTAVRVRAILRLIETRGGFGVIARRGDETAGDILLKVRSPARPDDSQGRVELYAPASAPDGTRGWMRLGRPGFADDDEAEAAIARAIRRDPDLWVLDLEPATPGFPLDEPVLDPTAAPDPTVAAAEALFRARRA